MKKVLYILILLLLPVFGLGQIITTYAGGGSGGLGDGGQASDAQLGYFQSIATDRLGNLYISDVHNNRIRKVDASGIITTFAGNGTSGFSGDGGPATAAQFGFSLYGFLATDKDNNLFISDCVNYRIRKVSAITGIVNTIAGNGVNLHLGDGGPATAASFSFGATIATDKLSNLYVVDSQTWVRKIDTSGIITNYVGNGIQASGGDGGAATAADLICVGGITCDFNNNLFTSSSTKIRKVNFSNRIITTVAGNGSSSAYADGVLALSSSVQGWFSIVDPWGRIYLSEYGGTQNKIRKVDTNGIISTVVGTGAFGFGGDGGAATAAKVAYPAGLAFDPCGNLFIADEQNQRVRKVMIPSPPFISLTGIQTAAIGATVTVNANVASAGVAYSVKWMNRGFVFATTTVPYTTYTKTMSVDSITARVITTSCGGNDSNTSLVHVVRNNVQVGSLTINDVVTCYPNPVTADLVINASGSKVSDVAVFNLLGEVVFKQTYNDEKQVKVNMADLAKGLYFIRVNGVYVQRVVKE